MGFFERWGPALAIFGTSATPTEALAGTATGAGAADGVAAVDALAAVAVAELPAALEVPEELPDEPGVLEEPEPLEEPEVLEEPGVLEEPEVPEEPELLEPEDVLTGVRRERPDERCLRRRPLELDASVEVLSADTPAVEGVAAWDSCSEGWVPAGWP